MDPQDALFASDDCYCIGEDGHYYEDEDLGGEIESISVLWGIYRRPEPVFNDSYFSPKGR
jgi:hypothetical protein